MSAADERIQSALRARAAAVPLEPDEEGLVARMRWRDRVVVVRRTVLAGMAAALAVVLLVAAGSARPADDVRIDVVREPGSGGSAPGPVPAGVTTTTAADALADAPTGIGTGPVRIEAGIDITDPQGREIPRPADAEHSNGSFVTVTSHRDGEVVADDVVALSGRTVAGATVRSRRTERRAAADGTWSLPVTLEPGRNSVRLAVLDDGVERAVVELVLILDRPSPERGR